MLRYILSRRLSVSLCLIIILKDKQMKKLAFVLSMVVSTSVFSAAYTATDEIKSARYHTVKMSNANVENIMTFVINKPLEGGCIELYLSKDDRVSQSMIIAAKSSAQEVTFSYTDELPPPWGDIKVCAVRWLQI